MAVDTQVSMRHELSNRKTRRTKAKPVGNVIQPHFQNFIELLILRNTPSRESIEYVALQLPLTKEVGVANFLLL
jgi:hypothetical protein